MGVQSRKIVLTERQDAILRKFDRARRTERRLGERVRIVLMSADGVPNLDQATRLNVDIQRVRRWRNRWSDHAERLLAAEQGGMADRELEKIIVEQVLMDLIRSGTPTKFTAEEVAQIIAVACEDPEECGIPVSHWTPADLTREVIKRGIVESISPRHVDRFLKSGRLTTSQKSLLA